MTNVFILKLFTKGTIENDDYNAQKYCLKHNYASIGWGSEERKSVNEIYEERKNEKSFMTSYNNLCIKMEKGDFVWTQANNARDFKLGKILDEECITVEDKPIIGITRRCEWHDINFDYVPGEIINAYQRRTRTLIQKHRLDKYIDYFEYLYDDNNYTQKLKLDYKKLLHYDDLEDLLGLYLQVEENYFIIPSTCKTSTKFIEYELIKKEECETIKKACVQCKTGETKVNLETIGINDFKNYHIYLSTMKNDEYKGENITTIKTDELWDWAKKNKTLLPGRIQKYIEICN